MSLNLRFFKTLSWIYLSAVLLVSILPLNSTSISMSGSSLLSFKNEHTLHAFAFLPTIFLYNCLLYSKMKSNLHKKLYSVTLAILFAFITEYIQHFLSYRSFSINDLAANFIGVFMGSFSLFFNFVPK